MKTRTTKNLLFRSSMTLALMVTIHTPISSWSAEPGEGKGMKMESKMMEHMMQHMQMGKESMSKCPMMKEMNEKSDGAHAEDHEKSE